MLCPTFRRRHVAVVLDVSSNSFRGYLDGEMYAEVVGPFPGIVSFLDCPVENNTHVPFGAAGVSLNLRDLRMYTGEIPSDDEIRAVAALGRSWCAAQGPLSRSTPRSIRTSPLHVDAKLTYLLCRPLPVTASCLKRTLIQRRLETTRATHVSGMQFAGGRASRTFVTPWQSSGLARSRVKRFRCASPGWLCVPPCDRLGLASCELAQIPVPVPRIR